jgi:hypothetical protein
MASLKLDILIIPTYSSLTLGVMDISTYLVTPTNPYITIDVPGFGPAVIPFNNGVFNSFDSISLGINLTNSVPIPDGIYRLTYSITPTYDNFVSKTIMRTEKIQEKFDKAFLKLDMMECDRVIKTQSSIDLNTINFFIQGSIAAANNCADFEANKLYKKANKMLDSFLKTDCGCSGNNYQLNFN